MSSVRRQFSTTVAAFAVAFLALGTALGASAKEVAPGAVDAIFAPWNKPTSPGCALAVFQDGKIIYEHGYGMADLEQEVPVTPATPFYVGSVSKQFTAACVALLAQRGALSLDDNVRKFVPELPDYGSPITIRHLIHHTSGLRDYLELRSLAGEPADGVFGEPEVLALICRQKALNFPPGSEYLYSNSGYFLLSLIVKRTSGESLRDFAAKNVFQPLGMQTAQFRDDHTALIPHRAAAYVLREGRYHTSNPNFDVYGAGGLFLTVRDFLAWDENFYTGKVGGENFAATLTTPARLNDGKSIAYAFGLMVGTYRGLPLVEHSGSYGGFRAHVLRFPREHFSVVCFGNLASFEPGQLARRVADLYLAEKLQAPAKKAANPSRVAAAAAKSLVPASNPESFIGDFLSEELGANCRIALRDGHLTAAMANHAPTLLQATGADVFTLAGKTLRCRRDEKGRVESFALDASRIRNIVFLRR